MLPLLFLQRVGVVLVIAGKYIFRRQAKMPDGTSVKLDGPKRLLLVFEDLGGVFFKIGQILSMRFDLLSLDYALALLNLLDKSRPVPNDLMWRVFEEEIGFPIDRFFEIEETPLATASFAQVYKGRYQGAEIVVKIQKPGVTKYIEADLLIFSVLAKLAEWLGLIRGSAGSEMTEQLRDWVGEELDYNLEADNARIVYNHVKRHRIEEKVMVPYIYTKFSRTRVLVQEFLPGIQASRLINPKSPGYEELVARLEAAGTSLPTVAETFVRDLMRQYFIDGFFHADPHPGNLMIFANNKIGYIDFGIIGRPVYDTYDFLRYVDGATTLNFQEMAEGFLEFAQLQVKRELGHAFEKPRFRKAFHEISKFFVERLISELSPVANNWHYATANPEADLRDRSTAVTFLQGVKIAEKYRLSLPPDVIAYVRALLIIDMVCLRLDPNFNMVKAIRTFFEVYPIYTIKEKRAKHISDLADLHEVGLDGFNLSPEVLIVPQKHPSAERELLARERFTERLYILADRYPELYNIIKKLKH